jgi:MoaA/NifB/PqqE/SkfB family radical SAM enzyme
MWNYYCIAARLIFNALRFRYARIRVRPLKPAALSLAVTNRCNSHCIMCNIWKSARDNPEIKSQELSLHEIIDILSSPVFSELVELDLTGGEPHLRDDLVNIVLRIAHLKNDRLSRLRSIIITSNGFLTGRILASYREILSALRGTNVDLVSVVSLDGIGEIHDLVRGTPNAFRLASETLVGLSELKKEYPNLIVGIKTTILPQNIAVLDDILGFALSNGFFHIISPVFFTVARFKNIDKRSELEPEPHTYRKLAELYNRDELRTGYFYSMMRRFLTEGRKLWTCAALYSYLFIDFDGKVYPCELSPEPLGNVKEQDITEIWNSPWARGWRKRIERMECCQTCQEPGAVRYSAFIEGLSYLRFLVKSGKHAYEASFYGEGYSKYASKLR